MPCESDRFFIPLGLVAAFIFAVFLHSSGAWGLFGLLGVVAGLLVIRWPFLGLLLLTTTIAIENLLVFEGAGGATGVRLLGIVVFGAWIIGKLLRRESFIPVATSALAVTALTFFAFAMASTMWASVPAVARAGTVQLAQFIALSVLVLDLVSSWKRADLLVKAVMIGAMIAAFLALEQAVVGGRRRAGDGIAGGISSTAILLVTCLPFAFYLLRSQRRVMWQVVGLVYIGVAVPATVLTLSRMNMLVLPPLLAVLCFDTLSGRRGRAFLVGAICVGSVVGLYSVPMDRFIQRTETIVPYLEGTVGQTDQGIVDPSPRGYHMRIGLAIAREHPLIGAGYRNYGHLFRDQYQFTVPGPGRVWTNVRSPHSSHIGMLADLGLVGFTLWLALVLGAGLRSAVKAWKMTSHARHEPPHLLARAVAYALALQVFAYGWSQTVHESKLFWVLLGLAAASAVLARSEHARTRRQHPPARDRARIRLDSTAQAGRGP